MQTIASPAPEMALGTLGQSSTAAPSTGKWTGKTKSKQNKRKGKANNTAPGTGPHTLVFENSNPRPGPSPPKSGNAKGQRNQQLLCSKHRWSREDVRSVQRTELELRCLRLQSMEDELRRTLNLILKDKSGVAISTLRRAKSTGQLGAPRLTQQQPPFPLSTRNKGSLPSGINQVGVATATQAQPASLTKPLKPKVGGAGQPKTSTVTSANNLHGSGKSNSLPSGVFETIYEDGEPGDVQHIPLKPTTKWTKVENKKKGKKSLSSGDVSKNGRAFAGPPKETKPVVKEDESKRRLPSNAGPSYAKTVASGPVKASTDPLFAPNSRPLSLDPPPQEEKDAIYESKLMKCDEELTQFLISEFMFEPRDSKTMKAMGNKAKAFYAKHDMTGVTLVDQNRITYQSVNAAMQYIKPTSVMRNSLKNPKSRHEIDKHNKFVGSGQLGARKMSTIIKDALSFKGVGSFFDPRKGVKLGSG
ncbi:MAG: hypothetical protein [Fushun naranga aenescens tombus-like virus 1]|nr:MAG: hypothetical protein [Fushun naranga aenescens tombus-like virus 1]UHR49820.1 MAG: hypothetical protein [Fushun naranga aenescens tombus-like virus 1]UHR49829.1 MAG: hypothetical protein [Fushun naranga aenescens tombus-like virus 1]UHR49842.1 MAG: hypothetical protein [Fushun naranga aenescens tombus-like virus 1]UHR49855.1 MAG: hypothetical protein [Fushun naranga aenescens tombus-like virus 1]